MSDQKPFFGVRVLEPNTGTYSKQTLKQCCSLNVNEKKHHYNPRITEVDQGNFAPLVFTEDWEAGGMGSEGRAF